MTVILAREDSKIDHDLVPSFIPRASYLLHQFIVGVASTPNV